MLVYLRRLGEIVVVAFLAGAIPTWLQNPALDRVALHGAIAAGVAGVYGVLAKWVGDRSRPTVL